MAKLVKHYKEILKMIIEEAIKDPFGSDLRLWDLMSLGDKITNFMVMDVSPIYIAFWYHGCRVGSLDNIRARGRIFGEPYATYKLSHDNPEDIGDITIEILHRRYE